MEMNYYKMKYLEEMYQMLTVLGEKEETEASAFLVKNKRTGKIAVKKYVDVPVLAVYEAISQVEDAHLEKIIDYAPGQSRGIVITEYISGMTLREYMETKGLLAEQEACCLLIQLLEVLEVVHAKKIIHRDINPNNIMISMDGILKLIDFGIAREKKKYQNRDTTILGTAGYAAPEQFGFLQTDERTDIYALGVLLNKMLTGYFPGEQLYKKEPLRSIIVKCTAMDSKFRYQNVMELERVLEGTELLAGKSQNAYLPNGTIKTEVDSMRVDWLPGFRTGCVWKNVVAAIGYLVMLTYTVCNIVACSRTWQTTVLETAALVIYVWMDTLLAANIGNWDRKLPFFRRFSKPVMIVIRVFLWLLLFYLGVMLDSYVRYDMLGFPKT